MRVHASSDHPDFHPHISRNGKVFLNGEIVKMCIYADDESGFVDVYQVHDRQVVILRGRPLVNRLFGAVHVSY